MPEPTPAGPPALNLTQAFVGEIRPVRTNPLYAAGLVLVTLVMVLLPLAYIALIGAMGWVVYWHATTNASIFENVRGAGAMKGAALLYLGPLFAGSIAVLFMIKPLFAPRGREPEPFSLSRAEQPTLYGYVDLLCRLMGAPAPARIDVTCDVNASAGLRRGFLSFLGSDLVLTIGLPLAAGLTLRELTGVLAHEFGHFAQGWAMRLGYISWRINRWFARVVYERDAWDDQLDDWREDSGHWGITIIVYVAAVFVYLSRRVLWVLMVIGCGVSAFMARQQEFDADTWEARIAGSEAFATTSGKLLLLGLAQGPAMAEVKHRWQAGKLPDNLVALFAAVRGKMPEEIQKEVDRRDLARTTGWFDSHPARKDRVAHAASLKEPGVFRLDAPATALFRDFDEVCRRASYLQYRAMLGERVFDATLVPTEGVLQQIQAREARGEAASAYLGGVLSPLATIPMPDEARRAPADPAAALAELRACRAALEPLIPRLPMLLAALSTMDDRLDTLAGARAVIDARLIVVPMKFKLADSNPATLESELASAESTSAEAAREPREAATLLSRRLELALSILRLPDAAKRLPDAEARLAKVDALLDSYAPVMEALRTLWPVHRARTIASLLAASVKREEEGARVAAKLKETGSDLARRLRAARDVLAGLPFTTPEGESVNLSGWVIPTIPPADAIPGIFDAASESARRILSVYQTLLTDLSQHAQTVEDALKLPPLR